MKRYKSRITITGIRAGRRVKWLTYGPFEAPKGVLNNRVFFVTRINDEGQIEYVTWAGQLGVCTVNGKEHKVLPQNVKVTDSEHRVVIYACGVPQGREDEAGSNLVAQLNESAQRQRMPPANITRTLL